VDIASTLGAWQGAGDARLWKAIVSPEQATRLDLRAHARALVAQMKQDLGTALEWVAIDHHDTDNPHVHLLIRGRDDGGRPLAIDPTYVQRGIRERSAELATRVLGFRSEHDILVSREQAVERAQFTELDRRLLTIAGDQRRVRYTGRPPRDRRRRAQRTLEMRRLDFLVTLGVAERTGAGAWELSPDLERTLRQAQLAGDILKSRARHQAHVSDPRIPLVVTRIEAGTRLAGRVVGTGLADELRDRRYLLLEGSDRRLHYIVQTPEMHAARHNPPLRPGDRIVLSGHGIERGGRQIMKTRVSVQAAKNEPAKTGPTGRPTERARPALEPGALPSLKQVERTVGRVVAVAPPIGGLIYRGRFVGYARGRDNQRHAVIETGRELVAVPTEHAELVAGRDVRATSHEVEEDRRRRLIWRLGADEREQRRERTL
jgi:type IV secretory pathway VirD2 relaxase